MMKKVYVFLADGFEDVEALIPVDVLRRGGVDVTTVSISDFPLVTSAHGVAGRKVAAICAAPGVVLGQLGLLEGKKATCYPGFEQMLDGATYTADLVTVDGNVTTAEGPAAAFPFAYELLAQLVDKKTSDQIAEGMRFKHLMQK